MPKTIANLFVSALAILTLSSANSPLHESADDKGGQAPPGWRVFATGDLDSATLSCINFSRTQWQVSALNGELKISEYRREDVQLPPAFKPSEQGWERARKHVLKFNDGWLVGIDAGEFGGGLWITNKDGSQSKQILMDNVKGIVQTQRGILVFSGLAHLTLDFGDVVLLSNPHKMHVSFEWAANLGSEPLAFAKQEDSSVLFATTQSVWQVSPSGESSEPVELKRLFWLKHFREHSFHPNSIAKAADGSVYLGWTGFIVRVPNGMGGVAAAFNEEFLVPNNCQYFWRRQDGCVCGP